jgi:hypothetical protein
LREALQLAACQVGLAALQFGPSTGISDLRHFANRSIPCMLYGPGRGFNPHRPDEHYYLADLPISMKFYLDFVSRWCGSLGQGYRGPHLGYHSLSVSRPRLSIMALVFSFELLSFSSYLIFPSPPMIMLANVIGDMPTLWRTNSR